MDINLNLLRSFVAVADAGSLSGAARTLDVSQPTLGRHVAELEEQLGVSLFERHPRGLRLTERGATLYEPARAAWDQAERFALMASGLEHAVSGTVRISAAEVVAQFILPPILAEARRQWPEVALEVVADNRAANLLRRDADIAIRMFRPRQPDVIARHIADAPVGLFAHEDYLSRYGTPTLALMEAPGEHTILGLDRDRLHLDMLSGIGLTVERETFAVRSDDQPFHVHATVAGVGIGAMQVVIGERYPELRRVLSEVPLPALPVWLVAHADVRRTPRIRALYDLLAEGLARAYGG